ncbi:hypothetical protein IFM62136_06135 [Aspergillus lentulus]|nr:hypothetical protein IFM62136_06135 [Aspergillus lentulus]
MVVYYQIAGKQVGSHILAMGVMGTLFGGIYLSTRGGGQKKQATPPIQASSKDEEKFIQYVCVHSTHMLFNVAVPMTRNDLQWLRWPSMACRLSTLSFESPTQQAACDRG